jgi:hypothetical protein
VLCDNFTEFDFVISKCLQADCSRQDPCKSCLEEIANYKTFYKIIQIAQGPERLETAERRTEIYFDRKSRPT